MEFILIIFLIALFFQFYRFACIIEIKIKWLLNDDMRWDSYDIQDMMFYGSMGLHWFSIPKDENYRVI